MTKKEALQSLTEYENDNLIEKTLLDAGLGGGDTYTAADKQAIDLAAAELYLALATHPELKEGSRLIKYNSQVLTVMANRIKRKYDQDDPTIDGDAVW